MSGDPGEYVDFFVQVTNRCSQVIDVVVRLDNLPDTWVKLPDAPTRLEPGGAGTISIRTSPPELPSSTAGDHGFSVSVVQKSNPDKPVKLAGILTVLPLYSLSMSLQPNIIPHNGQGQLVIENKGNSTESLALSDTDTLGKVIVRTLAQVMVDAAMKRTLPVNIQSKSKRPLFGKTTISDFTLTATDSHGGSLSACGKIKTMPLLSTGSLFI